MYRKIVVLALLLGLVSTSLAAQDVLVTYNKVDTVDILDRADGSVLSSTPLTLTGVNIDGTNGLSIDPTTGDVYVVIRSANGRELCTVDRLTGVCTSVGAFTDQIASIAFDGTGSLYAVTGDGATTPETLFSVDLTTAATTLMGSVGNGRNGDAIAFNPDDGLMYYLSGNVAPIGFCTIDLSTMTVTPIANSLPTGSEYTAFYYDSSATFLTGQDGLRQFNTLTTSGVAGASTAQTSAAVKGMVILPLVSPSAPTLDLGVTTSGNASTPVSLDLSGTHLLGDVTINASTGVEVSSTFTGGYSSTLNLNQTNGALTTRVFVRMQSGASPALYAGQLDITTLAGDPVQVYTTGQVDPAPTGPEMGVVNGLAQITDNNTHVLGTVASGTLQTITYEIQNTGVSALTLGGTPIVVVSSVLNVQNLSVTSAPATSVSPNTSTTFTVSYEVPAASSFGFEISIDNNDSDESPYNWTVIGAGDVASEIDVTRGGVPVVDGSIESIGSYDSGTAFMWVYNITNNGTAVLDIQTPVVISGESNCSVTVTAQPRTTVAVGGSTDLVLSVTPTGPGIFTFSVWIDSNDPNEGSYFWATMGTGTTVATPSGNGGGGGSGGDGDGGCSANADTELNILALLSLLSLVAVGTHLRTRRG